MHDRVMLAVNNMDEAQLREALRNPVAIETLLDYDKKERPEAAVLLRLLATGVPDLINDFIDAEREKGTIPGHVLLACMTYYVSQITEHLAMMVHTQRPRGITQDAMDRRIMEDFKRMIDLALPMVKILREENLKREEENDA